MKMRVVFLLARAISRAVLFGQAVGSAWRGRDGPFDVIR